MKFHLFVALLFITACNSHHESAPLQSRENHSAVALSFAMLEGSPELDHEFFVAIQNRLSHREKNLLINDQFLYLNELDLEQWKLPSHNSDFLAVIKLMKYHQVELKKEGSAELEIDIHLSVYDLREEFPHCIVEKIITSKNYIPKHFAAKELVRDRKEEGYELSPYGLAHTQIAKDVASHIEDAVLFAKRL